VFWSRSQRRAEEPKLICLPEPKLRIATPAPFYFHRLEEILYKKIMAAKEVFENWYTFNPFT
jgi:hypothetical protein